MRATTIALGISLACVGVEGAQAAPVQTPAPIAQPATTGEVIAEIRVHGNHISEDDEIVKIAGITLGAPFGPATIAEVTSRLRAARRFDDIDVLKRFASIADPTKIALVIVVNEGPVRIEVPRLPGDPVRVVKKRGGITSLMWMPLLDFEDGYGVTYGARAAYVGLAGERSRLSFPLTWGGLKRAGAEFDHTFARGPLSRIEFGSAIQRRRNPAFEEDDDRKRLWVRGERVIGRVRVGATGGWQRVSFGGITCCTDSAYDDLRTVGADVTLDTRLDPVLPRNAVYTVASWERIGFSSGGTTDRTRIDARGYLGLIGQTVLVGRVVREDASASLPPYLKSLLGGWSNLRGFEAGTFVGDTLAAGSLELRVPVSSPLSAGKLGVSAFVDTGTAYAKGERFGDQTLRTGIGGAVWMTTGPLRLGLSVARGRGADTRVNFGGGLSF